ncbi:hypothetical protein OpiT1DRAFT_00301 [Opitutaceae bacterium TAV1]|nr:hypothetical protein OpiT1DRAFT_00301 [Opitutaceae bacterium TAV1]
MKTAPVTSLTLPGLPLTSVSWLWPYLGIRIDNIIVTRSGAAAR